MPCWTDRTLTANVNEPIEEANWMQREEEGQVLRAHPERVAVIQLQVRVHGQPQVLLDLSAQPVQQVLCTKEASDSKLFTGRVQLLPHVGAAPPSILHSIPMKRLLTGLLPRVQDPTH